MTNFLKKPFTFGKITLPNNIFYSPLAGCSDHPFRQMAAKYRPGLIYCEMVKMEALIRNDTGTMHILDYDGSQHPIGAQLVGSNPAIAGQAARMIEELGFDVVDFNCGCPVDKVTKDGSGSGMLKKLPQIGEIIANMVAAVKIPVTVKIRAGWDENHIVAPEITRIAEEAGATAIAIHARTREQGYSGPARWEWIKACKEVAKNIIVIGNGDVKDGPSAERMFQETGCDVVLASRSTMGQPWIVQEIIDHLTTGESRKMSFEETKAALQEHFELVQIYHADKKAMLDARRIGCWYIKSESGTKQFRHQMSRVETLDEAAVLIASPLSALPGLDP